MQPRFVGVFSLGLVLIATIGCGGAALPEVVNITGTINYQGKAVEGAQVVLNNNDPAGKAASGMTDAQGKFTLQTYVSPTAQASGAMPGSYKVTVTKLEKSTMSSEEMMKAASGPAPTAQATPKNLLPQKYASLATTDLPAEVKKGDTKPLVYELKD